MVLQQLIHTKYVLNKKTYYNLYKTKAVDTDSIKSFLNNLGIPQLSEEQKLSCEGQITIEECKGKITSLQEMMESQVNFTKIVEILFANHSF